jgi:putative two-component system hydrogenase maturation factor HypX/HoxX
MGAVVTAAAQSAAAPGPADGLRVLFVTSAHNGLSQRVEVALRELGHQVEIAVVEDSATIVRAVRAHAADVVVCPMLKAVIPEVVWQRHRCLIVHPGPVGDRGPSSLDWAIECGEGEWGVTVLEAGAVLDGGDVWASRRFAMRDAGKSSLYRHEVRRAAVEAVVEAVSALAAGRASGEPPAIARPRPPMRQRERAIDWGRDSTVTVLRRLRAAEGHPGVLDRIDGTEFHLFGAQPEATLRGTPGQIVAHHHGAICRATVDGAVWIAQLKRPGHFKLPATRALALAGHTVRAPESPGFRDIAYTERAGVGYLGFDFYNGAMSTGQARRLLAAYHAARARDTRAIVLTGGADAFSTGIHLNVIEAAADPAWESWRNLQAIDDVVQAIIETEDRLVISALAGDAAAGGVPLALAADHVLAGQDAVLNPYYRHMGGLYGSEYWTYLLPRRVGPHTTAELTSAPYRPVGAAGARDLGLVDAVLPAAGFGAHVRRFAEHVAHDPGLPGVLRAKRRRRAADERYKPLAAYRAEELAHCRRCFFGPDRSYHVARHGFVHKLGTTDRPVASSAAGG